MFPFLLFIYNRNLNFCIHDWGRGISECCCAHFWSHHQVLRLFTLNLFCQMKSRVYWTSQQSTCHHPAPPEHSSSYIDFERYYFVQINQYLYLLSHFEIGRAQNIDAKGQWLEPNLPKPGNYLIFIQYSGNYMNIEHHWFLVGMNLHPLLPHLTAEWSGSNWMMLTILKLLVLKTIPGLWLLMKKSNCMDDVYNVFIHFQ